MRRLLALIAVAAVLLGTGCAGPEVTAPAGVSVAVQQNRGDIAVDRMQIRVENGGDQTLTVTRAALSAPRFEAPAVWQGRSEIAPGAARNLPVLIPVMDCTADAAGGSVELVFLEGGFERTATLDVGDPSELLPTLAEAECTAIAVAAAVDLSFTGLESDGRVALLTLAIERAGDADVVVDSVARTVLLQPEDGAAAWPVGTTSGTVTLRAVPARCDPHAVAEDKVGTLFPVTVTLDGTAMTVTVPAPEALRAEIRGFIAEACGW
jgi:hypothetical protein